MLINSPENPDAIDVSIDADGNIVYIKRGTRKDIRRDHDDGTETGQTNPVGYDPDPNLLLTHKTAPD